MLTFFYTGYDNEGRARRGHVDAEERTQALRILQEQGVFAEKLELAVSASAVGKARRAALYRELSALLSAGLPLEKSMQIMMESEHDSDSPSWAVTLAPARDALRDGATIAAAIRKSCGDVDGYEIAALEAAEKSATLPQMLMMLAQFLDDRNAVAEKIRTAAFYPCFVLAIGIGVAFLTLGVLIPRAQAALESAGLALPPASVAIVGIARAIALTASALLAAAAIGGFALSALRKKSEAWRIRTDAWKLSMPVFGKMNRLMASERFARTLGVLVRAGTPVVEALPLAGKATSNSLIEAIVGDQSEKVRHGEKLSSAIARVGPLNASVTEWARIGEAGGCLEQMLDVAADRAQRRWNKLATRWLTMLEPIILIIVGAFVLAVALAVIIPVTSLAKSAI